MEKIKIIIADDHKIFLDGIASLLSEYDFIEIIAKCTSAEQLIEVIEENTPNLIITDISMKGMSGIEATKLIVNKFPQTKVLILSMHTSEEFVLNSVKSGAMGYLPKDASIEELIDAIKSVSNGREYFSREISYFIFRNYISRYKSESMLIENHQLTTREIEILKLAAAGLTNKEIADKLFISVKTVDTHKNHIMNKLKLKNSVEMALFAVKHNLISDICNT